PHGRRSTSVARMPPPISSPRRLTPSRPTYGVGVGGRLVRYLARSGGKPAAPALLRSEAASYRPGAATDPAFRRRALGSLRWPLQACRSAGRPGLLPRPRLKAWRRSAGVLRMFHRRQLSKAAQPNLIELRAVNIDAGRVLASQKPRAFCVGAKLPDQ